MKRIIEMSALALTAALLFGAGSASAAERNYDCTKAGNANKAVCKGAAAAPAPVAKSAAPAKAASAAPAARNYDCSKPGNANKAVCKNAAAPAAPAPTAKAAAPAVASAAAAPAARNYDCTKAGNANKAACKTAASAAPAVVTKAPVTPAPAARAAAPSLPAAQAGQATAQCKDGTTSKSQHRTGTCSNHGGVAKWLVELPK